MYGTGEDRLFFQGKQKKALYREGKRNFGDWDEKKYPEERKSVSYPGSIYHASLPAVRFTVPPLGHIRVYLVKPRSPTTRIVIVRGDLIEPLAEITEIAGVDAAPLHGPRAFPREILVVGAGRRVQVQEIVGQVADRGVVTDVDVGVGRRVDGRVVAPAQHDGHDVLLQGVEEFLRDIVLAHGGLEGEVEFVVVVEKTVAVAHGGVGAFEWAAVAVNVDAQVFF